RGRGDLREAAPPPAPPGWQDRRGYRHRKRRSVAFPGVETAHDVLVALTRRYAFGEVAALVPEGTGVEPLCAFGQGLLDLDAEDFGAAGNGNDAVPAELVARAVACRMPQEPRDPGRGALGSLVPVYRLLLEVIAARWRRRE